MSSQPAKLPKFYLCNYERGTTGLYINNGEKYLYLEVFSTRQGIYCGVVLAARSNYNHRKRTYIVYEPGVAE